jgi:uncharacterized repeat protein (TIGR01451 family)
MMSAPHTVAANFQCNSTSQSTAFVTQYALNGPALRNNFTGWVGMKLTVGTNPLSVTSVGRICVAGNSGTHTVKFVYPSTGEDVTGSSALVEMAQCPPGQFVYAPLASSITLQANTSYYLVSEEVSGGDQWYDHGAIAVTADAVVNNSIYTPDSATWIPSSTANSSYVPPNFLYSLPSAGAPDLTISLAHSGTFKQGDTGDTYIITVTNSGTGPTTGTVSVTDTVPGGLTGTLIAGSGWACAQPAGPCTRGDALAPGCSYPSIVLTVNVASDAPATVSNTVTVSG